MLNNWIGNHLRRNQINSNNHWIIVAALWLSQSSPSCLAATTTTTTTHSISISPPRFLISHLDSNFTLIDPISISNLKYPLFFIFPFHPLDFTSQLILLFSLILIPSISYYYLRDHSLELLDMLYHQPIALLHDLHSRLNSIISTNPARRKDQDLNQNQKSTTTTIRLRRSVQQGPQQPISSLNQLSTNTKRDTSSKSIHSESSHYPGLYNTGNTCFFNSVLQSVSSCRDFHRYLDNVITLAERYDVLTPVTDSAYDLIEGE